MATRQEQGGGYRHENTKGLGLIVEFWCTTKLVYMHCLAQLFMFQIWTEDEVMGGGHIKVVVEQKEVAKAI